MLNIAYTRITIEFEEITHRWIVKLVTARFTTNLNTTSHRGYLYTQQGSVHALSSNHMMLIMKPAY